MKFETYIENEIIPRYLGFDRAHGPEHAKSVIDRSLKLAEIYGLDLRMVYAAAAYHDTGLAEGRERHHLVSGRIIREDRMLREWFTEEQIETIAEAAEDHRASAGREPRSIYGRVLAEADRQIDPELTVRRTVQYGLSHYPEMGKEEEVCRRRIPEAADSGVGQRAQARRAEEPDEGPEQVARDFRESIFRRGLSPGDNEGLALEGQPFWCAG